MADKPSLAGTQRALPPPPVFSCRVSALGAQLRSPYQTHLHGPVAAPPPGAAKLRLARAGRVYVLFCFFQREECDLGQIIETCPAHRLLCLSLPKTGLLALQVTLGTRSSVAKAPWRGGQSTGPGAGGPAGRSRGPEQRLSPGAGCGQMSGGCVRPRGDEEPGLQGEGPSLHHGRFRLLPPPGKGQRCPLLGKLGGGGSALPRQCPQPRRGLPPHPHRRASAPPAHLPPAPGPAELAEPGPCPTSPKPREAPRVRCLQTSRLCRRTARPAGGPWSPGYWESPRLS